MGGKILLSVVIPVYNTEKYLEECLDSIFDSPANQDEYEVIAVNDGSADNSLEILRRYETRKNFYIITQENGGPGSARNTGLSAAKGKYIYFVDSDDYLLEGAFAVVLCFARDSEYDIVEFDNQVTDENNPSNLWFSTKKNRTPRFGRGKDIFVKWHREDLFCSYVMIRIYRKDFLADNALCFRPRIFREDEDWNCRCFFHAETFRYQPAVIYSYRRRKESASAWLDDRKTLYDLVELVDSLTAFRNSINTTEENREYLSVLGDLIAGRLERAINIFYKSALRPADKDRLFRELAARRHLLGLASGKKGKRIYMLTRFLPARAGLKLYKVL